MKKFWPLFLLSLPVFTEVGTTQEAVVAALTSNRVLEANTCGNNLASVNVERTDENSFTVALRYRQQQLGLKGLQSTPCNLIVAVKATVTKARCLYEVTNATVIAAKAGMRRGAEALSIDQTKRARSQ